MGTGYTALRDVGGRVRNRLAFQGNNIYGQWEAAQDVYVVYSYGSHWPLAVWVRQWNQWFVNDARYSCTTSRHRSSLALPPHWCISCTTEQILIVKATSLRQPLLDTYIGHDIKALVGFAPIFKAMQERHPAFTQSETVCEPA